MKIILNFIYLQHLHGRFLALQELKKFLLYNLEVDLIPIDTFKLFEMQEIKMVKDL